MWIFYVFVLSCVCYVCARLFICALWSPAGKGLTSWLSFVVSSVSLSLSHWYPGSGVVLDCIDSGSLHLYLLCIWQTIGVTVAFSLLFNMCFNSIRENKILAKNSEFYSNVKLINTCRL